MRSSIGPTLKTAMAASCLFGMHPFLATLFADGDYQQAEFRKLANLRELAIEIVRRPDHARVLWRFAIGGLSNEPLLGSTAVAGCAEDWENLNRKALIFLRLASIRLMLRKLCNPT